MKNDLRSLRHLVVLARRLSYSRAAEDLGLSQPALTRSIQKLEADADTRLFDRSRAGVQLTPQGRVIVEQASALLQHADEFLVQVHRSGRGEDGRVRFGMPPLPAWALLPAAVAQRIEAAPGLTNEVVVRPLDDLWPLLVAGEIEFLLSAEGQIPDAPAVTAEILGEFPVSLVVRSGHPLLTNGDADARFAILLSSRSSTGALPPDLLARASGPPHVIEDYRTLIAITTATDAIWLSSAFAVAKELESGALCLLDRPPEVRGQRFRMVMYTLHRRTQSPGALRLKEAFRDHIHKLARATSAIER